MRLLVMGGTRFVGRAIVEVALERGHDVAMFNRGSRGNLFAGVHLITGDRNTADIEKLAIAEWDAVIDVSAYRPQQVRSLIDVLSGRVAHYIYISTVSVYADPVPIGADERAPLLRVDEAISADDPHAYGGLKVLCEEVLGDSWPAALTVLRPTVVIGPHDYTDRFAWWVRAAARGGHLDLPRRLEQPVQLIDAQDLAQFVVHSLEQRISGIFNTTGPRERLTLGSMLDTLTDAFHTSVEAAIAHGGDHVPLTLADDGSEDGVFTIDSSAAHAAGLTLRPLSESARAVLRAARAQEC
jgi:2'-hydroxyisoflavone reductase